MLLLSFASIALTLSSSVDTKEALVPKRSISPMDVVVDTIHPELAGGSGGVSVDAKGYIYVADFGSALGAGSTGGDKVWRLDAEGGSEVWAEGFRGASGNTFDASGNFYQSNIGGNFVERLAPDGARTIVARTSNPVGVVVDEEGILFVASCGGNRILEVPPEGEAVATGSPLFKCPNGITIDPDHNLYVANFGNGDVLRITPMGDVKRLTTLPGNNNGHLEYHEGYLYVVARGDHRIYRVSLEGEVEVFAGNGERGHRDGPALEASFSFPNDLAFSPDGRTLYVNENSSTTEPGSVLAPMMVRRIRLMPASKDE